MGGFSNAVVGGMSKLIRAAIQSPNFVHAVSGWSVNKDGTAEFLDLVARGDLSGSTLTIPEGAGPTQDRIVIDNVGINVYTGANLVTQIRSQSSNTYPMYTNIIASMPNGSSTVDIGDTDINLSLSAIANQPGAFTVAFGRVDLAQLPGVRSPTNPDVFGFGLGPQGAYYYEEATFSKSFPNNSSQLITGLTVTQSFRDYNSGWNTVTGVWTCPGSGIYTFCVMPQGWTPATYQASIRLERNAVLTTGIGSNVTATPQDAISAPQVMSLYMNAGDTFGVRCFQNSGAAQTLSGLISIRREL